MTTPSTLESSIQPKTQSKVRLKAQPSVQLDDDGHLLDHTLWNETIAQQLADTLPVSLEHEHFQILQKVRNFYVRFEHAPNTRPLIKFLTAELPELPINNAYLQQLFNTGLVARHLSRIAGLPKPSNCL